MIEVSLRCIHLNNPLGDKPKRWERIAPVERQRGKALRIGDLAQFRTAPAPTVVAIVGLEMATIVGDSEKK